MTGGAAVVLAGGGVLIAQARDTRPESLPGPPSIASIEASAPLVPEGSIPAVTASSPTPAGPASATTASAPSASPGATGKTAVGGSPASGQHVPKSTDDVRAEIDEARARARADGIPLQRPPEPEGAAKRVEESGVRQWTETIKGGMVRVTTARQDLTGASALLLAGDRGKPVGAGVSCTNKIRFTRDAPPTVQPTVLLCWRTSPARSVVTMVAEPGAIPSAGTNVAIIDREWAKLH